MFALSISTFAAKSGSPKPRQRTTAASRSVSSKTTLGAFARRFMGKKLYSKAELFDAINQAPLWHAPEDPAASGLLSGRLSNARLRPYRPRKKQDDGGSTAS